MAELITMPRLSDTMTEGKVAKWHKNIGDKVKEGDVLVLYPNDVHMPGLKVKEAKKIKKLVFKVPLNEL